MKALRACAVSLALGFAWAAYGQPPVLEPGNLLADAEGWELVYAHCSACHSLRLVTAQRGDRATWLRLIRWMQDTQNLWQFDPVVEQRILDYLAENYPPRPTARRAPLPEHLLP
jgi:hypothetical protein